MEPRRFVAPIAMMVPPPPAPPTDLPASSQPGQYGPNGPSQHIINHNFHPTAMLKRQPATQTRSYGTPPPKRLRSILPSATPSTESPSYQHSSVNVTPEDEQRGRSRRRFASPFKIIKCDEHPAFFSGHIDPVVAIQDQQRGITPPPIHSQDIRICQNQVKHPDAPYYVCAICHDLAQRHLKATAPILLKPKFLPLCKACGQRQLKKNFEKNGRQRYVFGCSCLYPFHEEWRIMCFDCRESALMSLKERWVGEMESRTKHVPGPSQDAATGYQVRGCRCSTPSQQPSVISVCPGCEGIRDERRLETFNSTGYSNMNRLGGTGATTREHSDVRHDLGILKAPEPQYQKMKAGTGLLGGEQSGMGMEAPEQHSQVQHAGVRQQSLKYFGTTVAGNSLDSREGAFNAPEPQIKADDVGVRPQASRDVAVRARDSDEEYKPVAMEDDDLSSPTSSRSLTEDS